MILKIVWLTFSTWWRWCFMTSCIWMERQALWLGAAGCWVSHREPGHAGSERSDARQVISLGFPWYPHGILMVSRFCWGIQWWITESVVDVWEAILITFDSWRSPTSLSHQSTALLLRGRTGTTKVAMLKAGGKSGRVSLGWWVKLGTSKPDQ